MEHQKYRIRLLNMFMLKQCHCLCQRNHVPFKKLCIPDMVYILNPLFIFQRASEHIVFVNCHALGKLSVFIFLTFFSSSRHWQFGKSYCTVSNFIAYFSVAVSVFTLMAISIDRWVIGCILHTAVRLTYQLKRALALLVSVSQTRSTNTNL